MNLWTVNPRSESNGDTLQSVELHSVLNIIDPCGIIA